MRISIKEKYEKGKETGSQRENFYVFILLNRGEVWFRRDEKYNHFYSRDVDGIDWGSDLNITENIRKIDISKDQGWANSSFLIVEFFRKHT